MRILYLSQYFPPEAGATQTRAHEMARNWVRLGHSVTLIAEVPNHPSGIIPPEYRGRLYAKGILDGIEVIRVWVKASSVKSFRNRILFYLTYMLKAALAGLLLARGRYDLLYASSPPLFVGGAALAISNLRRIPLVFEVRDLWPESAVALGELNNRTALAWATRLEEACYRRAKRVVVVTNGIRDSLLKRGLSEEKLVLVPNGANVDMFRFDAENRMRLRQQYNLGNAFVAIYAGIYGVAQGLETIVEAARFLRDESDIHFLLVGDGPKKGEIAALVEQYNLTNLTLLPEQPRNSIPALLSAADVALIPLRNLDLFKGALPYKMFDAWACERPVLLSVDGEARQIMAQAGGGVFVPPENPEALARELLKLKSDRVMLEKMGHAGREFTAQEFSRQAQAEKLLDILQAI